VESVIGNLSADDLAGGAEAALSGSIVE